MNRRTFLGTAAISMFSAPELAAGPAAYQTPRCGSCGLYRGCNSPKMKVAGEGRKGILVVGEAPGQEEDAQGKPFVGPTGKLLQRTLRDCGVDLFRDCWVINSCRCKPPRNDLPEKSIDYCRPFVTRDIEELEPTVIILLGKAAVRSVLGALGWSDADTSTVSRWVGWQVPLQKWNCWVCPSYHPSHIARGLEDGKGTGRVTADDFARHLKAACAKKSRPWGEVPDWADDVNVILDPNEASERLHQFRKSGGVISWDLETNMLKPDHRDSEIICCSVCWQGKETIAYPWHGAAIKATKSLLLEKGIAKIGYNLKFEIRHIQSRLGFQVRGWLWDGMLSAHCLDSRRGVSGLKFQAFVRLGMSDYSSHIRPYLEGQGGYGKNRIREVDITALCRYCALDSLAEFRVAESQMKEMGIKFNAQGP